MYLGSQLALGGITNWKAEEGKKKTRIREGKRRRERNFEDWSKGGKERAHPLPSCKDKRKLRNPSLTSHGQMYFTFPTTASQNLVQVFLTQLEQHCSVDWKDLKQQSRLLPGGADSHPWSFSRSDWIKLLPTWIFL